MFEAIICIYILNVMFRFYQVFSGVHVMFRFYQVFSIELSRKAFTMFWLSRMLEFIEFMNKVY